MGRWLTWGDTVHSSISSTPVYQGQQDDFSINSTAVYQGQQDDLILLYQVNTRYQVYRFLTLLFLNGFQFCWCSATFSTPDSGMLHIVYMMVGVIRWAQLE